MVKVQCENPVEVVKEAFWLAWLACGSPMGMGWLQNRQGVTKDDVWNNVQNAGDYPGGASLHRRKNNSAYGDYVFGRMMKLSLYWNDDSVTCNDVLPQPDYQAWCRKYKSYKDLMDAAMASLRA